VHRGRAVVGRAREGRRVDAVNFTYFALIVLAIVVAFLLLRALGVMG
jgi:hypothetical protein